MTTSLATEVALLRASALSLLEAHNISEPPVNVYQILRNEEVQVDFWPFQSDNIEGLYRRDVTGPGMVINKAHHPVKQRFTAGHELKHHRLDFPEDGLTHTCLSSMSRRKIERQANTFSAELLIPPAMLQAAIDELGEELWSITTLARAFRVSYPAMVIRLNRLEYISDWRRRKYFTPDYRYMDKLEAYKHRHSGNVAKLKTLALIDALGQLEGVAYCPSCSATLFDDRWWICSECCFELG